jgi:hypothetical protein
LPDKDHRTIIGRFAAFGQQVVFDSRYGFLLIPLAFLSASLKKPVLSIWFLLIFQAGLWIGFTHLQGRFMVMAIPLIALLIANTEIRVFKLTDPIAAIAMILIGSGIVFAKLQPKLASFRPVIGIDNLNWAHEDLLANWPPGQPLNLVGDARAFLYPIPMTLLHYKTVFDVDANDDFTTAEEAWLFGMPVNANRSTDLDELKRLSSTYYHIPPP